MHLEQVIHLDTTYQAPIKAYRYKSQHIMEHLLTLEEDVREITKCHLQVKATTMETIETPKGRNKEGDVLKGKAIKVYNEFYGRIEYIKEGYGFKTLHFTIPQIAHLPIDTVLNSYKKYEVNNVMEQCFLKEIGQRQLYISCIYWNYIND